MKFVLVLASVAACVYSSATPTRSTESEALSVFGETVDGFDGLEIPSGNPVVVVSVENPDAEQDPEDTESFDIPGLSPNTEYEDTDEVPGLSTDTEVIVRDSESVSTPDGEEVDVTIIDGIIVSGLPVYPSFEASTQEDRALILADLNGLLAAFASEKSAFEHIFDKTTDLKVADKGACWKRTIDQILRVSVDGTKLKRINLQLKSIYPNLDSAAADQLEKYKQLVFTGNNTYITQILDESKRIADNLEDAINTMMIDRNC